MIHAALNYPVKVGCVLIEVNFLTGKTHTELLAAALTPKGLMWYFVTTQCAVKPSEKSIRLFLNTFLLKRGNKISCCLNLLM